jgi:hypothetical protein
MNEINELETQAIDLERRLVVAIIEQYRLENEALQKRAEAAEDLLASLETVLYTDMLREEEVLPTIYDLMKEHGYKGPTSLENS